MRLGDAALPACDWRCAGVHDTKAETLGRLVNGARLSRAVTGRQLEGFEPLPVAARCEADRLSGAQSPAGSER